MLDLEDSWLGVEMMPNNPKTVQQACSELDQPAKERIEEQAYKLFTLGGVNISTSMIAQFAHTNVATVLKHFGSRDQLVFNFLKSLMKQADRSSREIEHGSPNDPEAQLRNWVLCAQFSADLSDQEAHAQLSRAAVDFLGFEEKSPLLKEIERFRQAERIRIIKLCEQAKFRDPSGLADKLLLIVQGARNERNCYGFSGPSAKVGEAGDDLMVAHGAERKPLLEV